MNILITRKSAWFFDLIKMSPEKKEKWFGRKFDGEKREFFIFLLKLMW